MDVVTDSNGEACYDELVLSSFVGVYTVTETVPTGYVADGATAKTVSVTQESTCGDGNEATVGFTNTPLTNITVSVDSQVPGGTMSDISCMIMGFTDEYTETIEAVAPDNGDGGLTVPDIEGTKTVLCTINIDP